MTRLVLPSDREPMHSIRDPVTSCHGCSSIQHLLMESHGDGNGEGEIRRQPAIALLGCGIFARDAYLPVLESLRHTASLRYVWSRSESKAQQMLAKVRQFAPDVEAEWGDYGLDLILASPLVHCCAIALPILTQPAVVTRALRAGKHVLQEKPVAGSVEVGLKTMALYNSLPSASRPIWTVAENYRFEPAFHAAAAMVKSLGTMVSITVTIDVPMTRANKYFGCDWRRDPALKGGFILDCGVHFVAGLRVMTGCDIKLVTAIATHRDAAVPAPDTLTTLIKFNNGCAGSMVVSYAAPVNKASWRVACSKGTVTVERGTLDNKFGYYLNLQPRDASPSLHFYPLSGLEEEWQSFLADVQNAIHHIHPVDTRGSPREALKDLAIVEAALASGLHADAPMSVKPQIV